MYHPRKICFALAIAAAASLPGAQPISPWLFGANLWNADTPGAGADRTWPAVEAAGLKLIRIGGISYNDNLPSAATFARWIDSIRAAGAEPLVQVSSKAAPSSAADLVAELNVKRKYGLRFWAIGNEPTCGKSADAGTVAGIAANFKARASAMKAVDPSLKIFVGDECYWRPELYDPLIGGDQDITGKDGAGRTYADIISFHSYPFPGADKNAPYTRQQVLQQGVAGIRSMLASCKTRVTAADTKNARTGDAALGCALTEFNVTYANPADNGPAGVGSRSFLDGQFFAEIYGAAMELGTFAVLPWSLLESNGSGAQDDLGMFDLKAGAAVPRPSWRHLEALSRNFHGTFIAGQSTNALVRAFAARSGDTVAILLLNENLAEGGWVDAWLSDHYDEMPGAKFMVKIPLGREGGLKDTLPPQSSLLLVLKGGAEIYRWAYSGEDAEQGRAPKEVRTPVALAPSHDAIRVAPRWDGSAWRGRSSAAEAVELLDLRGVLVGRAQADAAGDWRVTSPGPGAYVLSVSGSSRIVIRP